MITVKQEIYTENNIVYSKKSMYIFKLLIWYKEYKTTEMQVVDSYYDIKERNKKHKTHKIGFKK